MYIATAYSADLCGVDTAVDYGWVDSRMPHVLWNYILRTSDLSNMFIIKFAEPLFACVFSAILLNEDIFQWQYLIAFILISAGIVLGNKTKKGKEDESKNI